ncbi:hypothetical protein, partial [Kistimonas scapharcae]|uniref:hypothetical protein n=1 Tax=Kistimonas scapharcae TaxID=1036133 RepID=UPI0031E71CE6
PESVFKTYQNGCSRVTRIGVQVVPEYAIAQAALGNPSDNTNMQARAALQQPLVMSGFCGEVDVEFAEALVQFASSFIPAAQRSNIENVAASHQSPTTENTTPQEAKKDSPAQSEDNDDLFEESL